MTSETTELPDYDQANAMVEKAGFDSSVAEVHGTICGVLASPKAEDTDWLQVTLGGISDGAEDLPKSVSELLLVLHQVSRQALSDEDFSFILLTPDASCHGIANCTAAVAEWCRGFLLGLSAGGLKEFATLPDLVREALEDLLDIADVVAEDSEDEQQQKAFVELEEYVRVCVQLVYDDSQHVAEA